MFHTRDFTYGATSALRDDPLELNNTIASFKYLTCAILLTVFIVALIYAFMFK